MAYTREQKEKLIRQFKAVTDEKLARLNSETNSVCAACENRINRKLNTVSVTLWHTKIRDILEVERSKRPTTKSLLGDIKVMRERKLRK